MHGRRDSLSSLAQSKKWVFYTPLALLLSFGFYETLQPVVSPRSDHTIRHQLDRLLRRPQPDERTRLRILHLIDQETHGSIMDRWFSRSQLAFAANTELFADAPLWGPGFAGYNEVLSLADNIQNQFGSLTYFDAILPYFNTDQVAKFAEQNASHAFAAQLKYLSSHGVVIMDRPHEMRAFRRADFMQNANITLTLCPYPNECMAYRHRFQKQTLLVHQPHPVSYSLFYHPLEDSNGPIERSADILLAGSLSPQMYPLRNRLWSMQDGGLFKADVRKHPGYPDLMNSTEKHASHIDIEWLEKQLREFSQALASHRICLVTASRWGYSLQKYGEAALAGCLMVGTIPNDRHSDFSHFVVPISFQDSDEQIVSTLQYWLEHDQERLDKVKQAQEYFIGHFLEEHYVQEVALWIRLAQKGQRGLILPHEWQPLADPLPMDG